MQVYKIVTAVLMMSLMATGSFSMQNAKSVQKAAAAKVVCTHSHPAAVRQPAPAIARGKRIAGFHVTAVDPRRRIYYKSIVDGQTAHSAWALISTTNPVRIPFNSQLTLMFARQPNDQEATTLTFRPQNAPGKTIVLYVDAPYKSGVRVQPAAYCNMQRVWGLAADNNINIAELAACTNQPAPKLGAQAIKQGPRLFAQPASTENTDIDTMSEPDKAALCLLSDAEFERRFPKAQPTQTIQQNQAQVPQSSTQRTSQGPAANQAPAPCTGAKIQPKQQKTPMAQPAQPVVTAPPRQAPKVDSVWTAERFDYFTGFFNPAAWIEPVPCAQMWQRSYNIKVFIEQYIESGDLIEYIQSDRCQSYDERYGQQDRGDYTEKGRMKHEEIQQIYEYLVRLQVELVQFNNQLCKCAAPIEQADHFQKMVAEVSNKIKQLDEITKSIETLHYIEQITSDDMEKQMENEKYRHRGPRSKTVDDLLKFLLGRFVAMYTNVGVGVNYGGGKPTDVAILIGPYSKKVSASDDANEPQIVKACRDRYEELAAAEAPNDALKATQPSTADGAPAAETQPEQSTNNTTISNELILFELCKTDLISFSDLLYKNGKTEKAQQLIDCANLFEQARTDLNKNGKYTVNTDIYISLRPLIQEAVETSEGRQEVLCETIATAAAGAEIVRALHDAGEHQKAESINARIKANLEHIGEKWLDKSCTTAGSVDGQLFNDSDLVDKIMRGEADDCLEIAGKSAEEQSEVFIGAMLGVGDAIVTVADPRNVVPGTQKLLQMGAFVVLQLGRAGSWQDAINDGDQELAQKYETQFKTANAAVASAATQWYEDFKKSPTRDKSRVISSLITTIAAGKPIAAIELRIIGAGLSTVSELAGKAGAAFRAEKTVVATTAEGMMAVVKAAEESEGLAAMEETENAAKGGAPSTTIATPYSGDLIKVGKPDPQAEKLFAQRFKDGETCVHFSNDPFKKEFDIITKDYIVETKPALRSIKQDFRDQAKAIFEAAKQTGRKVYFHFNGKPCADVINKLEKYERRYGIKLVIDTKPLN